MTAPVEGVAIVGMSVLLPGAPDLATYWRNLSGGVDAISDVPSGRWDAAYYGPRDPARPDRVYCRRGGFVDDLADVDAAGFGIMPNSVAATEPDQLIALRVAAEAIDDAGGADRLPTDRSKVGVVLGRGGYLTPGLVRLDQRVRTAHQLVRTLGELLPQLGADDLDRVREAFTDTLGPHSPEDAIGLVPNLAASRVANRLDLRGPAYTVDAACASSLVAVDSAVRELATGRCDVVLAGGVHHCHDVTMWSVFAQLGALSPSQRIRPFHREADGLLIGEGTGVVVLKRLADAVRDGDRVYAVVRGTGVASDGRTASLVSPDPGGQARAVRQAWLAAGLDPTAPDALGLLEAHGTATPAGDAAELATVAEVFGPGTGGERPVIGSVKSMIGHTMPAAGVASLVKAALAVHHGTLPPTLHCDEPTDALAATRFRPLATAQPWDSAVRRAGVNAFGFGGINAHVVLEQAPGAAARPRARAVREPERTLRLAADSPAELAALLAHDDRTVLAAGRDDSDPGGGPVRLGVVDPTEKRLALARRAVGKAAPWRGRNDVWFAPAPLLGPGGGRVAFVFPGLDAEFSPDADDVAAWLGRPAPPRDVTIGDVGRHGAGVVQLGRLLDAALRRLGVVPDAVAGHSVGEWTAMACAGVYADGAVDDFLASFRPDEMRLPELVFAVLGASADEVGAVLDGRTDVVLSHDNAPHQSIVCGPEGPVDEVVRAFRARGVLGQALPFRSGFHTPMLAAFLGPIEEAARGFTLRSPAVPIWSATTASPYPEGAEDIRRLFVRHLVEPVRFRPLVEAMHAAGFRAFVQLGAGQLGSLVADSLQGRDHLVVAASSAQRPGLAQLRRVATALWAEGAAPDLAGLSPVGRPRPRRPGVRLDLGAPLVSLDEPVRRAVSARLPDREPVAVGGELSILDSAADRFPVAAELAALLRDTAASATAVLRYRRPAPVPAAPAPEPLVLRVSLAAMPYLADHCFFRQRDGWPDPADGWPVVPATTIIGHLMAFAEQAAPGRTAVAVHDVRLHRWVGAIPDVDIPVGLEWEGPDRVAVTLEGYSRAVVELGDGPPSEPPPPWRTDPASERPPGIEAAQLYSDRWMFHGPRFRGVTELIGIGDAHARGVITTPPAPGALLDNVGQLLGYWIMATRPDRTVVFPVGMRHIRFHGPHPEPGERLTCVVRITSVTEDALEADAQLVRDGRVWAEFHGWADRRFDSDADTRAASRFPERNTLSRPRPGGWVAVRESWPDLASRELIMRNNLGSGERAAYDRHPPRGRRSWLLGRIAAKDAVRRWLWDQGEGDIFPAELVVGNEPGGAPVVTGVHGRVVPPLSLSLAHTGDVAVALVGGPGERVGIDVEAVDDRPATTLAVALTGAERELLARLVTEDEPEPLWFTRFWAAKEAVAKAEGTGLDGAPKRFAVCAVDGDALTVRVADRDYEVRHAPLSNPPGPTARRHVVAWTRYPAEPMREART